MCDRVCDETNDSHARHTHTRTLRQSLITVNLRAPLSQPLAQKQQESANVVGMLFEGLGYVLGFGD